MSPKTTLEAIFVVSLTIGLLCMIASIAVLVGPRRRRVQIGFVYSGMPTHLLRLCRELPPSPDNAGLVRLAGWSVIGFLIAMVGAGISGPMLAG